MQKTALQVHNSQLSKLCHRHEDLTHLQKKMFILESRVSVLAEEDAALYIYLAVWGHLFNILDADLERIKRPSHARTV